MAADLLKWFDLWTNIFGLSIFAKERGKLFLYWNRFRCLLLFLTAIFHTINFSMLLRWTPVILWAIDSMIFFIGEIAYIIVIHVFRTKVITLLKDVSELLYERQRHRIKTIITICTIFLMIQFFVSRILHSTVLNFNISIWKYFLNIQVMFLPDHILYCSVLFVSILLSCYFSCRNSLEMLAGNRISPSKIIHHSNVMRKLMGEINHAAGLPFLLLFSQVFIALPGGISVYGRGPDSMLAFKVNELLTAFLYCIIVLSFVLLIISLKKRLESKQKQVLSILQLQAKSGVYMTVNWRIALDNFSDSKLFEFAIFSIIPLDINLLFSLISTIITFSIFLLQFASTR